MTDPKSKSTVDTADSKEESVTEEAANEMPERQKEIGGRGGLDPTRYGDWEKAGRCIDF